LSSSKNLGRVVVAEIVGTFLMMFLGLGAVHAAVLAGATAGLWQVAVVWGAGVALAIYAVGAVSGAHLNPAITVALAIFRRFPIRRVPAYIAAQLIGAFLAAAALSALYGSMLQEYEKSAGISRGQSGSELSAMVYCGYFPNPGFAKAMKWDPAHPPVGELQAMLGEGIGTAFLAMFVLALTDSRNQAGPGNRLLPAFIGLAVAILISIIAPVSQSCMNPARDLGPRLFAYLQGWGSIAIPGPRGGFFTVYILAPTLGAIAGSAAYQYLVRPGLPGEEPPGEQVSKD
jgi:glycerol uptake facilitator protein